MKEKISTRIKSGKIKTVKNGKKEKTIHDVFKKKVGTGGKST